MARRLTRAVAAQLAADGSPTIHVPRNAAHSLGINLHLEKVMLEVHGRTLLAHWVYDKGILVGAGPTYIRDYFPAGADLILSEDGGVVHVGLRTGSEELDNDVAPEARPASRAMAGSFGVAVRSTTSSHIDWSFESDEPSGSGGGVVERRLTEEDVVRGRLRLGPKETVRLGLASHAVEVELLVEGELMYAEWNPRAHELAGPGLAELLKEAASPGQLVRLHRTGAQIEFDLVTGGTSAISSWSTRPVVRSSSPQLPPRIPRAQRPLSDRLRLRNRDEFTWVGEVGFCRASIDQIREALGDHGWDTREGFRLRLRGEELAAISGFDELLSVDTAKVEQMPHQQSAARKVLAEMDGRAILADEVGLGKTIEAGLVASELEIRGMVRRILVVCPAGLRDQWKEELADKFGIDARVVTTGNDTVSGKDNLIVSLHLATRERKRLNKEHWDLVIIDEAHKTGGKKIQEFLRGITSRYLLYLTATPVQNSLEELYRLVESLRPGTFRSQADFRRRFLRSGDRRTPSDPEGLRRIVSDVMVRTTRGQAGLDNVQRYVTDVPVRLSGQEQADYERLLAILRASFSAPGDHFRRRGYAQRLAAAPRALAVSLLRLDTGDLAPESRLELQEIADRAITAERTTRQQMFIDQISTWVNDPTKGKVLVFTQHTEVAEDLMRQLYGEGIASVGYHGGTSAAKRRENIEAFRLDVPVMVSTDAGAEGLNLQFCNCVLNYDLPWNPMRIEQRIGRVHRVTQRRDVYVANFFATGTVEDRVYDLLREKLRMFELLFGQITLVLGEIGDEAGGSVEKQISDAVFDASARRFDALGVEFASARRAADKEIKASASLSYLSTWDTSYRDGLTRSGAEELRPDEWVSATDRRAEVIDFVNEALAFLGANVERTQELVLSEGQSQQTFVTALLPEEQRGGFGGVDRLHIAFHKDGLDQHREAELCAVGTGLFDDFVRVLRPHGDLLIEMPRLDLADEPLYESVADLTYEGRTVIGSKEWNTTATWRVRLQGSITDEFVLTTGVPVPSDADNYEVLDALAERPRTIDAQQLFDGLTDDAVGPIRDLVDRAKASVETALAGDRESRSVNYSERIAELEGRLSYAREDDRPEIADRLRQFRQLQRALSSATTVDIEAQTDLLALRLTGCDELIVSERWRHLDGREVSVETVVESGGSSYYPALGDDEEELELIDICVDAHVIDSTRVITCSECASKRCQACTPASRGADCELCGRHVCGDCLDVWLCRGCASPVRQPEKDRQGLLAFSVGGGRHLEVGRTVAYLDATPLAGSHHLHEEISLLALEHGLPLDAGCTFDPWLQSTDEDDDSKVVELGRETSYVVTTGPGSGVVDDDACEALGIAVAPDSSDEAHSAIRHLVAHLRDAHDWSNESLVVREIGTSRRLELGADAVLLRTTERLDSGRVEVTAAELSWDQPSSTDSGLVATSSVPGATLELERIHRSYVLSVKTEDSSTECFIPVAATTLLRHERRLAALAAELGVADAALGRVAIGDCPDPVTNEGASIVTRVVNAFEGLSTRSVERPLEVTDLAIDQGEAGIVEAETPVPTLWPWAARLDPRSGEPLIGVGRWYSVDEIWEADAQLSHSYVVEGGEPPVSPLPEVEWFTIDRSGHPLDAEHLEACEVCGLGSCEACAPSVRIGECPACSQEACGICRPSAAVAIPASVPVCGSCERRLCEACGRSQRAGRCDVCFQRTCHLCLIDGVCRGCAQLHVASDAEVEALPSDLGARGHLVLVGASRARRIVVIAGGLRREMAILDAAGSVVQWTSGIRRPSGATRLLLQGARRSPVSDIVLERRQSGFEHGDLVLIGERSHVVTASVDGVDLAGRHSVPDPTEGLDELAELLVTGQPEVAIPAFEERVASRVESVIGDHEIPPGLPLGITVFEIDEWIEVGEDGLVSAIAEADQIHRTAIEFLDVDGCRRLARAGTRLQWSVELAPFGDVRRLTVEGSRGRVERLIAGLGEPIGSRHALLEQLRSTLGLPNGSQLMAGDLSGPLTPPSVSGAALVAREAHSQLGLSAAPSTHDPVPDDLLEREAGTPQLNPEVLTVPFDLPASLVLGPRPEAAISMWHACSDTWSGDAEHTVTYRVEGSATLPPPRRDDDGEASWEFVVDRFGHLADPQQIMRCEVCDGSTCRGCSEREGIGECPECRQPSCGTCRPRRRQMGSVLRTSLGAHRDDRCGVCGTILCESCGREQRSQRCDICARPTCHRCVDAGICSTCSSLRDATVEEVANLPTQLRAGGLSVRTAADGRNRIVTINGGSRREIAVVKANEIVTWHDLAGLPTPQWKVVSCYRGQVADLIYEEAAPFESESPADLVVSDRRRRFVRLLDQDRRELVSAVEVGRGDVPIACLADSIVVTRLPTPANEAQLAMSETLFGGDPVGAETIILEVFEQIDRVEVAASGLVRLAGRGNHPDRMLAPFEPSKWRAIEWMRMEFDEVRSARIGDVVASIAEIGPIHFLVIERPKEPGRWWRIDRSAADLRRVLLGRLLVGRSIDVGITAATLAGEFEPLGLTNGRFVGRTHELVAVPDPYREVDPQATARCLALIAQPPDLLSRCPRPTWAEFVDPLNHGTAAELVRVDIAVDETWLVHGHAIQLDYTVRGGETQAVELAFDTGDHVRVFTLDRSDHLIAAPSQCRYCGDLTCRRCIDMVVPCLVCGVNRCGRCGPTRHTRPLCAACDGAKSVGGARKLGKVGINGSLLRGTDQVHSVEIALTPSKGTITVTWPNEKRQWDLNPEHLALVRDIMTTRVDEQASDE